MASLTGFIETKVELIKLDIEAEVKKIVARSVIFFFIGLAGALAIFFISMALATFLNHLLESIYLGYGIIALLYLLIGLIAYFKREDIYLTVLQNLHAQKENSNDEE